MATMTETLKRAIRKSRLSLYAIAAASGVKRPSLSKFMSDQQSLRLDMADRLAEYFELVLTPKHAARRRKL